ncbi:LPS-assembly protein LptD [Pseudoalteromonas phenolica]|uniref:LPS-assembly protein LptD n=1 Tax=Pseudoalteromonas phenolica TaxID=161398 RepID=A0A5S3YYE2_9GAMM|nr:LPS assembly protein LptD [Pseudoalteromonas phenolica]TMP82892.1 LPS-assembly protein LptD [Pseudoalteromonas phenolica]
MNKTWLTVALFSFCPTVFAETESSLLCQSNFKPSQWQLLNGLPQNAIDIRADKVNINSTTSAQFAGNVVINTEQMQLSASSALINKQTAQLNAEGPLVYQDPYTLVKSNGLFADLNNYHIDLLGADYTLTQQLGHGGAAQLSAREDSIELLNASFTTCPTDKPFWSIEASTISLSKTQGWGETYNAVLRILDTPIIYIPYFTFPIDDRRKTGLLAPTISSSERYGVELITPFYWNIAQNYDATITPRYMSNKGLQLNTEFRYLTPKHNGLVAFELLEKDDSEPDLEERYLVHWQQSSYFNDNWRASIDITNVSDDNYLTDLNSEYGNATDTQLYRTGALNYLGEDWSAEFKIQNFEVLGDHTDSYAAMPQVSWQTTQPTKWYGIDWSLQGEFSHFTNEDLLITDASRLHIEPKASYSINDTAWSFLSEASLLHTYYQQEGDFTDTPYTERVARTLPKLRMHAQMNLERETRFFVDDGIQTLEPQLQYLYVPHREQENIGLYDTTKMQDDFAGLFREQRFSGVDRIAQANQFTIGATTRIYDNKNIERFNFSAGQILYLDSNMKPTSQNPLDQTNYNALFAAETMIHWHRRWYLSAGIQYDADTKQRIKSHATIDYKGDNNQLVQLNHHYANDVSGYEIDQIGMFTSVPLNKQFQFIASYHRDLVSKRSTEFFIGLQYESCCWAIQLTGNRQIETDLNKAIDHDDAQFDSSIRLNFVLKGLGGKSNYDVSRLLQQGIFGYRRPYFLNN